MDFWDSMSKHFLEEVIIQDSRDETGKIDACKAILQYQMLHPGASRADMNRLRRKLDRCGAFSRAELSSAADETYSWRDSVEDGSAYGLDPWAFDTPEDYADALHEAKYGWQSMAEDGTEFSLDPDEFETEEDYMAALEEAREAWREEAEDGSDAGVDPWDYDSPEEYQDALEEARYGWRYTCEDGTDVGVDTEDYETEEAYNAALEQARYGWREQASDGSDFGLDPDDYETEKEYQEDLKRAREAWLQEVARDKLFPEDYATPSAYQAALELAQRMRGPINRSDYPNERSFEAAEEYQALLEWHSLDKYDRKKLTRCEMILGCPDCLAGRYFNSDGYVLLTQAVKEHFNLPCSFPDEDDYPKTNLEDALIRIARRNASLAVEVWH